MALRKEAYSFALIIYTSIVVWLISGLNEFHLYLIGTNQVVYFLKLHIFFKNIVTNPDSLIPDFK